MRRALGIARIALLAGALWVNGPFSNWEGWWRFGEFVFGLVQNEIP